MKHSTNFETKMGLRRECLKRWGSPERVLETNIGAGRMGATLYDQVAARVGLEKNPDTAETAAAANPQALILLGDCREILNSGGVDYLRPDWIDIDPFGESLEIALASIQMTARCGAESVVLVATDGAYASHGRCLPSGDNSQGSFMGRIFRENGIEVQRIRDYADQVVSFAAEMADQHGFGMERGPVIAKEAHGKQIPMCFWSARLVRR